MISDRVEPSVSPVLFVSVSLFGHCEQNISMVTLENDMVLVHKREVKEYFEYISYMCANVHYCKSKKQFHFSESSDSEITNYEKLGFFARYAWL